MAEDDSDVRYYFVMKVGPGNCLLRYTEDWNGFYVDFREKQLKEVEENITSNRGKYLIPSEKIQGSLLFVRLFTRPLLSTS